MNPHLKHIPRLASLAARGLSSRHLEGFGRQAHGALNAEVLGLGALEELGAHFFQGLNLSGSECNPDLVDFLERQMLVGDCISYLEKGDLIATCI